MSVWHSVVMWGRPTPRPLVACPTGDFPLERSQDNTLCSTYDQVIEIDGQWVHPEAAWTYPHFHLRNNMLYRVSCDNRTNEIGI